MAEQQFKPPRLSGSLNGSLKLDGQRCDLEDVVTKREEDDLKHTLYTGAPRIPGERGEGYWASYLTVMSISFAGFVDYSVIMPSAKGYCDKLNTSSTFYGLSLAFYPLARILLLPIAGLAADKCSMKLMFFITVFAQVCGGLMYALADATDAPALILAGRLLAGMGSTNIAIIQNFIVSTSKLEHRSRAIAVMQAINFLGIAMGPALNFPLKDSLDVHLVADLRFNKYTGAGLMLALYHSVNMILALLLFSDKSCMSGQGSGKFDACSSLATGICGVWRTPGTAGVMSSAMLAMLWFSLLEALVAPIAKDSFGWNLQRISIFFAVFAVLAAAFMVLVGMACKRIPDRLLMAFSTPFYAFAAAAAWYKIPHTDEASLGWFYVLAALVSIGFTFQNAPSMGLFTKLMTGSEFEGLASSVALQAQGLGRVLGPLIAGVTLDNGGIKVAVMVLLVMLAIQTATIVLNWKRMEFEPNGLVSSHFSDYEINTSQIFHTPDCTPPASPSASFSGCEKLLGDADQYDEEAAQLVGSPSADDIPNLSGKWKHTHDDTAAMDRLLEASGVNWFSRKAFKIFHPELKIDQNGDSFDVHLKAAAGESHDKFKVGDQFVQYDASLKKDCTYASRWEREPGRPVKFHQLNVEMPKRGLRRWLETTGKGVYLVQELEIETGLRAKRYFTRQT